MTDSVSSQKALGEIAPPAKPATTSFSRFIGRFADIKIPFEIIAPDNSVQRVGSGAPTFRLKVNNARGVKALSSLDEGTISEAFLDGSIDISGDMLRPFELRKSLSDTHPLTEAWRFIHPLLFGQVATNRKAISAHYDIDPDFFLSFLDPVTPCYTQGVYLNANETLDVATTRKFEWLVKACHLKRGDHFLEIGPGWGAFGEHAAKLGLRMTGITNSPVSQAFLQKKAERIGAQWDIVLTDFLAYEPKQKFDAIVIMGVIEHIPDYAKVVERFTRLVKPGGYIFVDGSASTTKYELSSFMVKYIYGGNHSFLVLHDFLEKVAKSPLKVMELHNDTESYFYTFKQWAINFDRNRDEVVRRFGEFNFRRFQLYLWGAAYEFLSGSLDCYRMVLQSPEYPLVKT